MTERNYVIKFFPYVLLTGLTFFLMLSPLDSGEFFGSEGDWYSQHAGIAENIRQMMLSSHSLVPQYSTAGGGCNMYDYAYYGLLRPDIIFSCLIPKVPMKYIIAVYALLGSAVSVNLCYYWLCSRRQGQFSAFTASVLFISSTAFYHAHHQIVFINYMPFLIIALIGIDRLVEKGKSGWMFFGIFFIYIHSFFYAFSCLTVGFIYYVSRIGQMRRNGESFPHSLSRTFPCTFSLTVKAFGIVFISAMMGAVLLVPAGLAILSTDKDGGKFVTEPMKLIEPFAGLLHTPYGCGMTVLTLILIIYCLWLRDYRFPATIVLIFTSVPAVWLALNGFLYPRTKILIPLLPLIAYLCGGALQNLIQELPAGKRLSTAVRTAICLLLILPLSISYSVNRKDDYIRTDDIRQNRFTAEELISFIDDTGYRCDFLADSFVNCNMPIGGEVFRTAMYSSVTNNLYGDFFYDTMKNPISLRNRVVLIPNQNPFFNEFMGIRYLVAKEAYLPPNYQVIRKRNGYVLAENSDVRPICYGTSSLISKEDFNQLQFPETLEALVSRTVVNGDTTEKFTSHIRRSKPAPSDISVFQFAMSDVRGKEWGNAREGVKETVRGKVKGKIPGKDYAVDICGMRNLLSGESAPYPNHNHTFTYIFPAGKGEEALAEIKENGDIDMEKVSVWALDKKYLRQQEITLPVFKERGESGDGRTMFEGSIEMEEDGYFVTSFPYKKGYQVTVDGKGISRNL